MDEVGCLLDADGRQIAAVLPNSMREVAAQIVAIVNRRTPPEVSAEGVSEEAVEAACRAVDPELFGDDFVVAHQKASPFVLELAQAKVRKLLRAALLAALPHLRPSTPEVGSAVRELVTELERKRGAHVGVDLTRVWEAYDKLKPLLDGAAK